METVELRESQQGHRVTEEIKCFFVDNSEDWKEAGRKQQRIPNRWKKEKSGVKKCGRQESAFFIALVFSEGRVCSFWARALRHR